MLFVFLKASLPKDYKDEEKGSFDSGQGGELEPIMCVDKPLEELSNFSDLVKESEQMEQDWHIVLVSSISGSNGLVADTKEVERSLKMMVGTVQQGGDLSKFMAFERGGEPLRFN